MDIFTLHRGHLPLLISLPHNGTELPPQIAERLTPEALRLPDTDWHVSRLYAFVQELGATLLIPQFSRYVIDLNRSPDGAALYPGQNETSLCPLQTFAGESLYRVGQAPTPEEIQERQRLYWQPYHQILYQELARLRDLHGHVILWEGHSIRSQVPRFFDGRLPDFNLGTANRMSCSADLQQRLTTVLSAQATFSWVVNGRFKGGYITRHYGQPASGVEAVQLELAQYIYMDERNFGYGAERVKQVIMLIKNLLLAALQ